ncbi:glucose dehydrogenase [FAD, quinone]-like [Achroia grisella]|uniref:glucose dehydrogenase [FAD, quinone]-like n=1 Tax=Achroia grisella TaxID=688607 RepID=UPI0027D20071|nr:glucose dehydrogenase [FAD, quinone]-like [Achroia grisella]
MMVLHYLQFIIISICIKSFTVYIYIVYYTDVFWSTFSQDIKSEYDFIIVGSGTAGSVIAHRLATETNYTFIVVEAGGKGNVLFEIPVLGPLLHGSIYDWQYETVPQDNACYAFNHKKCKLFQGKIFGGSSKLNNMVHVRGNISHYVDWFHREYDHTFFQNQFKFIEETILNLDEIQYQSEMTDAVLDAAKELGYNELHSEFAHGFRRSIVSQTQGKRWSSSDNIDIIKHVVTNALVEKVLVKENIAYGVSLLKSSSKREVYAKKGVILSSGTYNTPKILQLSGIGPSDLLKSFDIPVIADLPVGKNLQDHVATGLDLILFNESLSINTINMLNLLHAANYFINGKGPFTTPGCEVIGFLATNGESPDLQFMVLPVGISSDKGSHFRNSLGINTTVWTNYFAETYDKHSATILPIVLHPKSKGEVLIQSRDPTNPPMIDPKYLSDKNDRVLLIKGLKLVKEFLETEAMKSLGASINEIPFPGCNDYEVFSDNYWECYIKQLTLTSYHPVGTCSMGFPYAKTSVVDTSFKVIGVNNLFVADGSVLPTLPSGNINAAIAMMASVFFDINIVPNISTKACRNIVCPKYDFIYEHIHKMCYL